MINLVTAEDLPQLGLLLTDKYNILTVHLTKYVSSAGEQAEKGLQNVNPFVMLHFICLLSVLLDLDLDQHNPCSNNRPGPFPDWLPNLDLVYFYVYLCHRVFVCWCMSGLVPSVPC